MNKVISYIFKHKALSVVFLLAVFGAGYYEFFMAKSTKGETRYVLGAVQKGTIISSVSGTGQVSASDQVDIKPKVSGDLIKINVASGQEVKEGDVIAQIDDSDAQKAVRDAQVSLETSKLDLAKLVEPADAFTIMQSENDITNARNDLEKLKSTQATGYQDALDAKQKAEDNLAKNYEDAFNTISNIYLDLPTIKTDIWNVLYSYDIIKSDVTAGSNTLNKDALSNSLITFEEREGLNAFSSKAESDYASAETKFEKSYQDYKNSSRSSSRDNIDSLLNGTIDTARAMADTVKSEINMLDYWINARTQDNLKIFNQVDTYETTLKSDTSKTNSSLSNVLSAQSSIVSDKDALQSAIQNITGLDKNNPIDLANAEWNITVKENALATLKAGPDAIDIRTKQIAVQQKQDALNEARQNLSYYKIQAPFSGVIADVGVQKGDAVSSGTVIATLVTKQGMSEISLNEVDIAKIKVGQKVTITFDAIPDFTMTGKVAEVGTIGAVSQGVVSYTVKINFDTQDDRVKPGMSVSASIIIDAKQDILVVPSGAIKSQGGLNYVEVLDSPLGNQSEATSAAGIVSKNPPRRQTVQIGLADDSNTEIVSGLKEGDVIVVKTMAATSATPASNQQSPGGLRIPGLTGGGGGNFRQGTGAARGD